MALQAFDFEKPLIEIEEQIRDLRESEDEEDHSAEITKLEKKKANLHKDIYTKLEPWDRIQIARHMDRPRSTHFITQLFTDWCEVHGDRGFGDDKAVACGLGRLDGMPCAVIGQRKGADTRGNVDVNFGMMHPEGYRKALRLMRTAERFNLPVIIFIDTPGAYPGIGAEERGQSEAIARNIMEMFDIKVPLIGVIIGEGASGGALGVGVVDHMIMMENAWYCVISPEGCASILWRDASKAPEVAKVLRLTGPDLIEMKVVDEVVDEPLGGAHKDPETAIEALRKPLLKQMKALSKKKTETLLEARFQKYRHIGVYEEEAQA